MNLAESIAIGLVFGFIFYEWIGLSAGGFVVPGYIALQLSNPLLLAATLATSLLTYGSVKAASRFMIVYGRRRFILMVLVGFAWQWLSRALLIQRLVPTSDMDVFGFSIPGLIANEMDRQRILPTVLTLMVVSVMVRLVLIGLGMVRS